ATSNRRNQGDPADPQARLHLRRVSLSRPRPHPIGGGAKMRRLWLVGMVALAALAAGDRGVQPVRASERAMAEPPVTLAEAALQQARVNGKYRMLLRQIRVPD